VEETRAPPGIGGAELPARTLARAPIKSLFVSRSLSLAQQFCCTLASEPAAPRGARREAGQRGWSSRGGAAPDSRGRDASSLCARLPPSQRPVGAPNASRGPIRRKKRGAPAFAPPRGAHIGEKGRFVPQQKRSSFVQTRSYCHKKNFCSFGPCKDKDFLVTGPLCRLPCLQVCKARL